MYSPRRRAASESKDLTAKCDEAVDALEALPSLRPAGLSGSSTQGKLGSSWRFDSAESPRPNRDRGGLSSLKGLT